MKKYIERFKRTLKEKYRMGIHGVLFNRFPRRMVVELVYAHVFWHNFTIPDDYISDSLGPEAVVLGRTYDYNNLYGEG